MKLFPSISRALCLALTVATLAVFATPALAGRSTPLVNPPAVVIPATAGKAWTEIEVRDAIVRGGAAKTWVLKSEQPGRVVLAVDVRSRHAAEVAITYDAKTYRVEYLSSVNLNYRKAEQGEVIHPTYIRWVRGLMAEINKGLGIQSTQAEPADADEL